MHTFYVTHEYLVRHKSLRDLSDYNGINQSINHDIYAAEAAVATLTHALNALVEATYPRREDSVPWADILEALLNAACNPAATQSCIGHAADFLACSARTLRKEYLKSDSVVPFLVSLLRSPDVQMRIISVTSLMGLHRDHSETGSRLQDPNKLLHVKWPPKISDAMMSHGFALCEVTRTLTAMRDFQQAMIQAVNDLDMAVLGEKIVALICLTEKSVTRGMYQDEHGKPITDLGLPFIWWDDALPHSARALRTRDKPLRIAGRTMPAADAADILEIKYNITKSKFDRVTELAEAGIARSPNQLYFYYASYLQSKQDDLDSHERQLRTAKKGLARAGDNMGDSYLRHGLLLNAAEKAFGLGLDRASEAYSGDRTWEDIYAYLRLSYEDSKAFVQDAPPDCINLPRGLITHILLYFIFHGHTVHTDLRDIQHLRDRLEIADEIGGLIYNPPARTQFRLVLDTILKHFGSGAARFGPTVATLGIWSHTATQTPPTTHADVCTWLDELPLPEQETGKVATRFSEDRVELYRCASCRCGSAVLRRCSRCGVVRYCDAVWWVQHGCLRENY